MNNGNSVRNFLGEWMVAHGGTLRVRTARNYQSHIDNYINPVIGDIDLRELLPVDVAGIYTRMSERGISPATTRVTQSIISQALDAAVAWKRADYNAAKSTGRLRVPTKPVNTMTMKTLRDISAALTGARFENVMRIALAQGFRRGEVCALRWEDIDLDTRTIRIERQVVRVDGVGLVIQEPKTVTSIRTVPMTMVAYDILSGIKSNNPVSDWVFPGTGDMPVDPMRVYNSFQDALDRNGLPKMGLHQLRHAFGTILRAQGVSERTLMDLFGHSSTRMTARYGAVVDETKMEAVRNIDVALERV